MACKIIDPRLLAIKKIVYALIREGQATTLPEVITWMKENRPEITASDIKDSLVATSGKRIAETVKELNRTRDNIKKEAKVVEALSDAIEAINKPIDANFPVEKKLKEVKTATEELSKMLGYRVNSMDPSKFVQMGIRIEDIAQSYNNVFVDGKQLEKAHIETMKEALAEIKEELQIKKVDDRIAALTKKIDDIRSGNLNVDEFSDLNSHVHLEAMSKEVAYKQAQIADLKNMYDTYVNVAVAHEKIKQNGLLGYKSDFAIKTMQGLQEAIREGWETGRTLKYMLDLSNVGVQLAGPVMSDLYFNRSRIKDFFRKTIGDVLASDIIAAREGYHPDPNLSKEENQKKRSIALKRAHGKEAMNQVAEMKSDPLYQLVKKTDLILSESRSVAHTEEMWHSTILNRFKVFGLAKDISEDLMVSGLNYYRFNLFKEFYLANPGLRIEEYNKVAKFINEFTGTANIRIGEANAIMSAARLAVSRFNLALTRPWKVALSLDVPGSLKGREIKFQTAADQYIAKQTAKMFASYAATFVALGGILALTNLGEVGDDWEDTDFLRVTVGNNKYDFTGGMGAMYRMVAQTILTQIDPRNANTYLTQERLKNNERMGKNHLFNPFLRTMIENKLHPGFGDIHGVVTGKDYFEKPYNWFGAGEFSSRTEALIRSFLPISVEQTIETAVDNYRKLSDPRGANSLSNPLEDIIATAFQVLGVNSFGFKDKSNEPFAKEYFNKVKYKPSTDYPDDLSKTTHEKSLLLESLRDSYKNLYGTMVGNIIEKNPDISLSEFKSKVNSGEAALKRQFLVDQKNNIKQLKKVAKPKK